MPILSSIFSALAGPILDKIIAPLTDIFKLYINKQITEAQLREQIQAVLLSTFRDIEVAQSDALAKTYESFQVTLRGSPLLQAAWVALFLSQMLVLVWHQVGIPALCYTIGNDHCYPSSGTTVNWAYLLLAFMLGAGPVIFRAGPGEGSLLERLKKLVG